MSSNKTIIPGMEDGYMASSSTNMANTNMISQNGTCFSNTNGYNQIPVSQGQKPIVGFLYSISKTGLGEFWPLHIGSNSIGRSIDSDICLAEATVSDQHAVLVVRQMKNPEKIIASICDARSTCGTMINGESLGFDQRECFNGDIITIGDHYDLYFILIDAKQIGLNVCRDFMGIQSMPINNIPNNNPYAAPIPNTGTQGYEPENKKVQGGGTVGFNEPVENKPATNPGGTIFM